MSWSGKILNVLAIGSAAWVLLILIKRAIRKTGGWLKPLLWGVLCLYGIGFIALAGIGPLSQPDTASGRIFSSGVLAMAAGTAILALKFGWLLFLLAFVGRFAPPSRVGLIRRSIAAVGGVALLLAAAGWAEFLFVTEGSLFEHLQTYSDYFVFLATIGAGFFLRIRFGEAPRRPDLAPESKSLSVLGGLIAALFLCLGVWWIVGESVFRFSPVLGAVFIPAVFVAFNVGMARWIMRFATALDNPEAARLDAIRISEDLLTRWGISGREREIIELVGQGLSNREIAGRLFISLSTVKKHLNNIFQKTNLSNRVQIVRLFGGHEACPPDSSQKDIKNQE